MERRSGVREKRRLGGLAEDEDDLREALCDAIRDAGCEVIAVADVPTLERVLEQTRADVLLADYQLFDQTTEAVVTRVATRRSIDEIAIVSASPAARACAEKLAVRHIAKPFDLDHLLAIVTAPRAANG